MRNMGLSLSELAFHLEDVGDDRCENACAHELSGTTVPRKSTAIVEGQGEQLHKSTSIAEIQRTSEPDPKILRDPDFDLCFDPTEPAIAQFFSIRTAGPAGSTPTSTDMHPAPHTHTHTHTQTHTHRQNKHRPSMHELLFGAEVQDNYT